MLKKQKKKVNDKKSKTNAARFLSGSELLLFIKVIASLRQSSANCMFALPAVRMMTPSVSV